MNLTHTDNAAECLCERCVWKRALAIYRREPYYGETSAIEILCAAFAAREAGLRAQVASFIKLNKVIREALSTAITENRALREALEFIARWNLPRVPHGDGSISYGAAFGSNGERDYMCQLAKNALSPPPPTDPEDAR